jgi:hypothetical protein
LREAEKPPKEEPIEPEILPPDEEAKVQEPPKPDEKPVQTIEADYTEVQEPETRPEPQPEAQEGEGFVDEPVTRADISPPKEQAQEPVSDDFVDEPVTRPGIKPPEEKVEAPASDDFVDEPVTRADISPPSSDEEVELDPATRPEINLPPRMASDRERQVQTLALDQFGLRVEYSDGREVKIQRAMEPDRFDSILREAVVELQEKIGQQDNVGPVVTDEVMNVQLPDGTKLLINGRENVDRYKMMAEEESR